MTENPNLSGLRLSEHSKHAFFTTIYETDSDPSVLVKELHTLWQPGRARHGYTETDFYDEIGRQLSTLKDPKYGLAEFIPPVSLAWAPNPAGDERGFIIMKKVQGVNLNGIAPINDAHSAELDTLLSQAIYMGIDTLDIKAGKRVLPDIFNGRTFINIILGSTDVNSEIHPYIIDTFPASTVVDYPISDWMYALDWLEFKSGRRPFLRTRLALDELDRSPKLRHMLNY